MSTHRRTLLMLCLILLTISTSAAGQDYEWATGFEGVGFDGLVVDAVRWGNDLVVGGEFRGHSGTYAPVVARWDGQSWQAMGDPGWHTTRTLGTYGSELYAFGYGRKHLRRWDGMSWITDATFLGYGSSLVFAMVEYDGKLIISGDVQINGLHGIFAFDGTDFFDVGNSPPGDFTEQIYEMIVYDGDLYVTGYFTRLRDQTTLATNLARWNGTDWYPVEGRATPGGPLVEGLHGGTDGYPAGYALAVYDGKLVIGGDFTQAGDLPVLNLCTYDAATQMWGDIGACPDYVSELESWNGSLYVGGGFDSIEGVPAQHLARWDGASWSTVAEGTDSSPAELLDFGSSLVVAGSFHAVGDVQVERLAWWDGNQFSGRMDPGGLGLDDYATELLVHDDRLIVGGGFKYAGTQRVDHIAAWDGAQWDDLAGGANDYIDALTSDASDLIAVGRFTEIGGVPVNYAARWDGTTWHPYAEGLPSPPSAACMHEGELYVGGTPRAPDPPFLKRWDGANWLDVPMEGTPGSVECLASYGGELFVGSFSFGPPLYDPPYYGAVARYDAGLWQPLLSAAGSTITERVATFFHHEGELYLGGDFFYVETWTEAHAARWDGSLLFALTPVRVEYTGSGQELQGTYAFASYDGRLFLGGRGNYGGGRFYSWDGVQTQWMLTAGDINGTLDALAVYQNQLFLAGRFEQVGTNSHGGTMSARIGALHPAATASPETRVSRLLLEHNRPNPFNPVTTIRFQIPEGAGSVELSIYDIAGRRVKLLHSGPHPPGPGSVRWDGTDAQGAQVASGTYYYRLSAGEGSVAHKMVLLK